MSYKYSHSEMTEATYDTNSRKQQSIDVPKDLFEADLDKAVREKTKDQFDEALDKLEQVRRSKYKGQSCYYFNAGGVDRVFLNKK
ncbi:MAG: hypothetical protein ACJAS1_003267 [Oleiphilaceae bacterium]|jgi:hypothetical protein